jgi:hypothetical protein
MTHILQIDADIHENDIRQQLTEQIQSHAKDNREHWLIQQAIQKLTDFDTIDNQEVTKVIIVSHMK